MVRPFLEQLEGWIDAENFDELGKCEFKVVEMLRNYGRVVTEMEGDKASPLWNDSFALAIRAELKKLRTLVRLADKAYKKRNKTNEKETNKF
jgi:hypothetical protein